MTKSPIQQQYLQGTQCIIRKKFLIQFRKKKRLYFCKEKIWLFDIFACILLVLIILAKRHVIFSIELAINNNYLVKSNMIIKIF